MPKLVALSSLYDGQSFAFFAGLVVKSPTPLKRDVGSYKGRREWAPPFFDWLAWRRVVTLWGSHSKNPAPKKNLTSALRFAIIKHNWQ